jgi:subtilisin family serine protease
VLSAPDFATSHPAGPVDVVSLSLGSPQGYCPEACDTASQAARRRGVVVVAAAGNAGPGSVRAGGQRPRLGPLLFTSSEGDPVPDIRSGGSHGGTVLPPSARDLAPELRAAGVLVGGQDVVAPEVGQTLAQLLAQ